MEKLLVTVINITHKLNHISEEKLGCPLFYVEYTPLYSVAICTSEFIIWDNTEERYANCDDSELSILTYIASRLNLLRDEFQVIIDNFPSISDGMKS